MIKSRKERRQEWRDSKKNYFTREEWYQAWDKEFVVAIGNIFTFDWNKPKEKNKEENNFLKKAKGFKFYKMFTRK